MRIVSLIDIYRYTWYIYSEVWDRHSVRHTGASQLRAKFLQLLTIVALFFYHCWMELLFLDLAYWAKKKSPQFLCHPTGMPLSFFFLWDLKTFSCRPYQHGVARVWKSIVVSFTHILLKHYVTVLEFTQWIVQKSCKVESKLLLYQNVDNYSPKSEKAGMVCWNWN